MFVNRISLDFDNCEIKLEQATCTLYDTRQGESLATKLAYNIHTLLFLAWGAYFASMRDLLSTSNRSSRRCSSAKTLVKVISQTNYCCGCRADIKQLTTVQADLLLMKQRQSATEHMNNIDNQSMKT